MVPHSTSVAQEIGRPINNKPAQGTKTQTNNHYDVGKAIISPQTKDITKIKTQSPTNNKNNKIGMIKSLKFLLSPHLRIGCLLFSTASLFISLAVCRRPPLVCGECPKGSGML